MKYFAILTKLGAAKLANAAALGTKISITHMAVGDGGGKLPEPDANQTKLVNEKRRAAINTLSVDPVNTNQIIAEQIIPENEGGWWLREIGLFDSEDSLIAVANCPETYKPQLQEGSGRTQTVRMILIVNNTESVTLKVDPSVVLATREYVDKNTIEVKAYCDNAFKAHLAASDPHPQYLLKKDLPPLPDASLTQKGVVLLSSATNSVSETLAATPKAVKAAYDLAASKLASVPDASLTQKGITQLTDKTGNSNTLAATQKLVTDVNDNANSKLAKNQNGADIPNKSEFVKNLGLVETVNLSKNAVPSSRKINGKALTGDVSLSAGDVGAVNGLNNFSDLPNNNYVGIFQAGLETQWAKGINIGSEKGDIGQIYVDKDGNLYSYFLKASSKARLGGVVNTHPVGSPIPYPHRYTPPGYLTCNGQTFDKSLYPKLAEAYPDGKVPDLRGEFIRGWDDSRGVDPGRVCGSWQADRTKKIQLAEGNADSRYMSPNQGPVNGYNFPLGRDVKGGATDTSIANNTGGNETRPRNVAFNYIVRAI
ncbi:phage tail protein [Photorhabdus akhurstii]|uniref:phage tail-collar fiber domain-containing protein n=1 Tax=Photorhabdus akhurstii TaxID=171438 RepID=UPI001BD2424E|nr:phage tail protein [Photorhabdus akhurstii]MBS9427865.1 phage tail protein [Photorhabdus akhurstii]